MKWMNGKVAGCIRKRGNSIEVAFRSRTSKNFNIPMYGSDENALQAAKEFQKRTSDELGLTKNRYRKLPDGIYWNDDESNFPLTQNTYEVHIKCEGVDKYMLVDESDIEIVDNFTICAVKSPRETAKHYARIGEKGKKGNELFHKKLTGFDMVDHINRNPLDNRRCNLCETTHKLNNNNRSKPYRLLGTDSILGVRYKKTRNSWEAYIHIDYKHYSRSFSINKYGDEAKNMAIRARQEFNERFNCANS